jgi:hypothetical protein
MEEKSVLRAIIILYAGSNFFKVRLILLVIFKRPEVVNSFETIDKEELDFVIIVFVLEKFIPEDFSHFL